LPAALSCGYKVLIRKSQGCFMNDRIMNVVAAVARIGAPPFSGATMPFMGEQIMPSPLPRD
jgi:hypothetical protein